MILPVLTSEDIKAVSALAHEIWEEHYPPIIGWEQTRYMLDRFQSPAAMQQDIEERQFRYYFARDDESGALLGYCGVVPENKSVYISKLYIRNSARKKGLSRAFLSRIAEEFPEAESLYLSVNKYNSGSIEAYRHLGFTIEADIVNDIGNGFVMDDYQMRKMLRSPDDSAVKR